MKMIYFLWLKLRLLVFQIDAIVIASTSDALREYVLNEAGDSIEKTYYVQSRQSASSYVCTDGGNLPCKRIYFIPCPGLSANASRWLFRIFIKKAIEIASNDASTGIQSLAFPAIGCGQLRCNPNFVGKTLITAVAYELEHQPSLRFDISFVIEQCQQNILHAFQEQLKALGNNESKNSIYRSTDVLTSLPSELENANEGFIVEKCQLDQSDNEYKMVMQEFMLTMSSSHYSKILRIELVRNARWYKQYEIHKAEFSERLKQDTETFLFHGCPKSAARRIIKECFNRSCAGVNG